MPSVVFGFWLVLLGAVTLSYLAVRNDRRKRRDEFRQKLAVRLEDERELVEEVRSREAVMASDVGEGVKGMTEIVLNAHRRRLAKVRESIHFYRSRLASDS